MKMAHKILAITIALSVGVSLFICSVVHWLDGGYGRAPSGIAFGAAGWILVSLLVGYFPVSGEADAMPRPSHK